MSTKVVKVKVITGEEYTIPSDTFKDGNIPTNAVSLVTGYIRGTRGALMKVEDDLGKHVYINATMIVSVTIEY